MESVKTGTKETERFPEGALDRIREVRAARDAARVERLSLAGQAVTERFLAERQRIVPQEVRLKLQERAGELRLPEDAGIDERRRRAANQRAYAAELGVDLAALDRMRADFHAEVGRAMADPDTGHAEVIELPGLAQAPEESDLAGYDGIWDPGPTWYSSRPGDFAIWNSESFWAPGVNRAGSHIRFRQRESSNNTVAYMEWRNGYMKLHTLPESRPLIVDVDLTCQHSRFFIDTDDEPGGSACRVDLYQKVQVEVYSNWADTVAQETTATTFASTGTGATENWQDFEAFPQWSRRKVRVDTQRTYAAGQQIAVFVSIMNIADGAKLDDTRLTAGVNAAWHIDNILIRPRF